MSYKAKPGTHVPERYWLDPGKAWRHWLKAPSPQRLAKVFFSAQGRKAGNYYPEIRKDCQRWIPC